MSLLPGNFGCVFSEWTRVCFGACNVSVVCSECQQEAKRNAFVGLKSKFAELLFVT